MTSFRDHTTGRITHNNDSIQVYFGVEFSRSPRNPLKDSREYAAFCDRGVVVLFPTDQWPSFPLEVRPPAEFTLEPTP